MQPKRARESSEQFFPTCRVVIGSTLKAAGRVGIRFAVMRLALLSFPRYRKRRP